MGSNMQRQGVPLIVSEAPLVGTGLEGKVARDSHAVLISTESGKVASVTADQIVVTKDGHMPEGARKLEDRLWTRAFTFTSCGNSCARTRAPA